MFGRARPPVGMGREVQVLDLFEYPWVLTLLALVPLYGLLLYGRRDRRSGPMMFSRVSLARVVAGGPRAMLRQAQELMRLVALTLLILACARPSIPEQDTVEVEGIDIYVVLDLSGSMQAIDVSDEELRRYQQLRQEPPNRFNVARQVLTDVVRSRTVDRIGMVVFARDAFLQFPLTLDYGTILRQLDQLELGDIDGAGTAIGNALGRAVAGLRDQDQAPEAEEDDRTRIIVLITDGDRRGGNLSPMEAADFAVEHGIRIFPILVGSEGKARVPVGRDMFSGRLTYRYQEYPVNPQLLQDIAQKTGGQFYRASDKEGLEKRLHEILDSFERAPVEDAASVNRRQVYTPLALWALLLLALDVVLTTAVVRPFP